MRILVTDLVEIPNDSFWIWATAATMYGCPFSKEDFQKLLDKGRVGYTTQSGRFKTHVTYEVMDEAAH